MGLKEFIHGEFIDVIEWTQSPAQSDILAFRFPRYQHEIKMGARLTVREGQTAVFVNEGRIADVFPPGMYTLTTKNLPVLSTLRGWKHGFQSPFKAEVYFVVTTQQPSHKWGTSNPVIMRDADFGIIRLRAYGSYVFRISNPAALLRELIATDPSFEDFEIDTQLRQVIVARFSDVLGRSGISVLDLVGNYEKLSKFCLDCIRPEFSDWGIDITKFYVENISLPPQVEDAIDRRTSMGVVGDLEKYTQFQTAEAMRAAASNPGGAAGMGVGLGGGMVMAQAMMGHMPGPLLNPVTSATPPPLPTGLRLHVAVNGQATGPFSRDQLLQMIHNGTLSRDSLVWHQGMSQWQRAETVAELLEILTQTPPPVPKN